MSNTKCECTNLDVKIVKLTNEVIDAICTNCGKTGHAERKDYLPFEWKQMQYDAHHKHNLVSA